MRVLVTGSTGNLGEKAVAALSAIPNLDIRRIGRNTAGKMDVIAADLEMYDESWAQHFHETDAVLHLAADPKPVATWGSVTRYNVDLALNVLRAASEAKVKRFIFASSNWILGGYRFSREPLRDSTIPRPVNPYGASKLFIERQGLSLSAQSGMLFLSLRIGYCAPGQNVPGPHMGFGRWGQEMWLSNADWEQAVQKSCISPLTHSAVINIMSDNKGMRWDLDLARSTIGYAPVSHHIPKMTTMGTLKESIAMLRDRLLPTMSETPLFGRRW